ncbi:MAG TPA: DNA-protecting protein DprA [Thermoleophilia bacterium]|nr:DNA-protecting protein DprA [Thermoleophilia bacterium]HQJ97124.1 DNA-protecting protein DprA [Thermoleophilia bacterium]
MAVRAERGGDSAPDAQRDRAPDARRDRAPDARRDGAPDARRDRAVWLAELATLRRGLIGALVAACGGMDEVLALDPHAVAVAARSLGRRGARPRVDGARGTPDALGVPDASRASHGRRASGAQRAPRQPGDAEEDDGSLFAALLARGPVSGAGERADVVTWVDDAYPPQLRDLPDPPPALFLGGRVQEGLRTLATRHVVAVVGSRRPSPYGREMARAIALDLTAAGVVVVSGLALGIDAVAHQAALDAMAHQTALDSIAGEVGKDVGEVAPVRERREDAPPRERGKDAPARAAGTGVRGRPTLPGVSRSPRLAWPATVAVLGCGADVEHPPGNRALFARVRENGLLVSEFSWGVGARPWRFPARNRVMAALSEAVVVVEGAERSGALITAREALELGREVLAVPGEAGRRLSAGPHRLLRQGAALCESARDVLEVLGLGDLALGWRRGAYVGVADGAEDDVGDRGRAEDDEIDGSADELGAGAGRDGLGTDGSADGLAAGGEGGAGRRADRRLLAALDDGVQTVDQLAQAVGLDVPTTLARLALLEVGGAVESCGGGAYRLRRGR